MKTTSKKPKLTNEQEHRALEEAMKELSNQTDALLLDHKKAEVNSRKPTLPRKRIVPHTKGTNLDIVNHAPSSLRQSSPLKKDEEVLLEAHAGKSYNEVDQSASTIKKPVLITPRTQLHEAPRVEPSGGLVHQATPPIAAKPTVSKSNEEEVSSAPPIKEKIQFHEPLKLSIDQPEEAETELASPLTNEVELEQANKPAAFDATEYHSELHDWSKIAKPSRLPLVLFLLFALLLVASGYAYTSGLLEQFMPK